MLFHRFRLRSIYYKSYKKITYSWKGLLIIMSVILGQVSTFVNESISWITSYVNLITEQPLLLAFVVVSFVGLGIGLISRLIHI